MNDARGVFTQRAGFALPFPTYHHFTENPDDGYPQDPESEPPR